MTRAESAFAQVTIDDYVVTLDPLPALETLESHWRALESRSHCSFFLTWPWMDAWLQLVGLGSNVRLVKVILHSRVVALGLFTARRAWLGFGPLHLRLHETGNRVLDNLTVEYNGLLCEAGQELPALEAVVRHLEQHDRHWHTLYVPGIDAVDVPVERLRSEETAVRWIGRPTHHVDLAAMREANSDYISALGPNTRSAIRRTDRKITAQFGEIALTIAATADDRTSFFRALSRLHQEHWTSKQRYAGAFGDVRIMAFHERLLTNCDEPGSVQLMRLTAGELTVGYVYNVVRRGIVYFYQMGLDYTRFGDCGSPGLLLLSRAVEHALAAGHSRFEFMAGDVDYKRQLGTAQGELLWLSLDRIGPSSQLRRIGRWVRRRFAATAA